MRDLLEGARLAHLTAKDIPPVFREVAEHGWSIPNTHGSPPLSLGGLDEDLMTANVTFCTPLPSLPPYIANLEQVEDAAVAEISLEDCSVWG